jgi:hypothetical protein
MSNNITFKYQVRFAECKNIATLPFDFGIYDNNKLIGVIEYQGKQHYYPIKYWGGEKQLKIRQAHDLIKKLYCSTNNIPLLEVLYNEDNIITLLNYFMIMIRP